ncbi:hypothetical protein E3A20_29900 [Planctomyces bekefii]|uniref:Uncharacterized protein n=1 Tax=Planctomyces bekefii TaxID=1653850 RepID=A0A5C6M4F9_9PLAN|nr:hypothetical protein E3A20_29900 [Planctomyces bekefii]
MKQLGIWVSHQRAIVVQLSGDECSIQEIESPVESHVKSTGGVRGRQPYVHRSVQSTGHKDRRRSQELKDHYGAILQAIGSEAEVFLLGPFYLGKRAPLLPSRQHQGLCGTRLPTERPTSSL